MFQNLTVRRTSRLPPKKDTSFEAQSRLDGWLSVLWMDYGYEGPCQLDRVQSIRVFLKLFKEGFIM